MPAVVVVTSYDYPQYADAALRLGAAGFVVKTAPTAELLDAIRGAASGGLHFGVRPGNGVSLSEREREVVRLRGRGRLERRDRRAARDQLADGRVAPAPAVRAPRTSRHAPSSRRARIREGWLEEAG